MEDALVLASGRPGYNPPNLVDVDGDGHLDVSFTL